MANGFAEIEQKIETAVGGLRAAVDRRIENLAYKVDQLDMKLDQHRQETKDGFAGVHRLIGGMSHTLTDHEERIKVLEGE
jgi:hypothetical protein